MKILLPYYQRSDYTIDSPFMIGGLEKFSQLVYKNLPNVIPVHFTDHDRKNRLVTKKVVSAAREHNVDVIISNYENQTLTTAIQEQIDVPIMWISHSCTGGIGRIPQVKTMSEFTDNGGLLFMMSENQFTGLDKLSERTNNRKLTLSGYINSAFCSGTETPSEHLEYNATTIGRMNRAKDPFWLHKKLDKSDQNSLVLTSLVKEFLTPDQTEYYEENKHWVSPRETFYNQDHVTVLNNLSKSGCYVSTHPGESWGITALEALSHGIPTILKCFKSLVHSSECIPASPKHIFKVNNMNKTEFADLVRSLNRVTYEERLEISALTKEKHSREKWIKSIENAIDQTISNHKPKTNLFDLTQFI
jgi:hypothetical protein